MLDKNIVRNVMSYHDVGVTTGGNIIVSWKGTKDEIDVPIGMFIDWCCDDNRSLYSFKRISDD
jgi:hypothetical protein